MAAHQSRIIILRLIPALLAGLFLFTGAAAGVVVGTDPSLIVLRPGESTLINLTLDSAPAGLSGYEIGISMENPGIGEFTAVSFPSWADLSDSKGVPGSDIQIKAVDLNDEVKKTTSGIILATFTVEGLSTGTTKIMLDNPVFDEDGDNLITVSLSTASLTVSSGGATASGGSATGGGGSGSLPGAVTSPTLNQSKAETPDQTNGTGENQTPEMETPTPGEIAAAQPTTGDQTVPVTPKGEGIPFVTLPAFLAVMGIMAFLAAKKR